MPSAGIFRMYWPFCIGRGGAPGASNSTRIQPVYPSGIKKREARCAEYRVLVPSQNARPVNIAIVRAATTIRVDRLAVSGKIQLRLRFAGCRKLTTAE